jgi:pyrimidine operon attenuation protein/uracil phosphoribosyltransferase
MSSKKNYILSKEAAERKLRRMALEIVENNYGEKKLILAGIKESGVVVARCIQKMLEEITSIQTELISVNLNKRNPGTVTLSKKMSFDDTVVIVIDDVVNSGKTLLYALKPFLVFQPKKIQTLVLVERRHNSFPIHPDYVGLSVSTTLQEHIVVEVDKEKVLGAYLK